MFFTLEKLERNTKQLKDLRYRERMEIPSLTQARRRRSRWGNGRKAWSTQEL